jgi:hypothetical protein
MRRYRPWRQVGLKSTTSRRVYTPRCWFGYPKATPESGSKIVRRFSQPLVRSGPFGNVLRKCQQGKGLSQEQLDGRGNRSRRLLTARPLDYLQETPCQFANPIQFTTPDRLPIDQIRPIPTAAAPARMKSAVFPWVTPPEAINGMCGNGDLRALM